MSGLPDATPLLPFLQGVPTPALFVDVGAARNNHRRAVSALASGQMLRPHFKAHKCTALGTAAICCQTAWEAEALVDAGFGDIMFTNQLVDAASLEQAAQAARRASVSVLVDDIAHVRLLQAAASRAGSHIDVLVEVDLGMRRCGVAPQSDELLLLAGALEAAPSLGFAGIQAYDGQVAGMVDPLAPSVKLAVGDRTFILPRHVDPTVNLHSSLWFYEDESVVEQLVDGRMPVGRALQVDERSGARPTRLPGG